MFFFHTDYNSIISGYLQLELYLNQYEITVQESSFFLKGFVTIYLIIQECRETRQKSIDSEASQTSVQNQVTVTS